MTPLHLNNRIVMAIHSVISGALASRFRVASFVVCVGSLAGSVLLADMPTPRPQSCRGPLAGLASAAVEPWRCHLPSGVVPYDQQGECSGHPRTSDPGNRTDLLSFLSCRQSLVGQALELRVADEVVERAHRAGSGSTGSTDRGTADR